MERLQTEQRVPERPVSSDKLDINAVEIGSRNQLDERPAKYLNVPTSDSDSDIASEEWSEFGIYESSSTRDDKESLDGTDRHWKDAVDGQKPVEAGSLDAFEVAWQYLKSQPEANDHRIREKQHSNFLSSSGMRPCNAILRPAQFAAQHRELKSEIIELCRIREVLPQNKVILHDSGIIMRTELLLSEPLFDSRSSSEIPKVWMSDRKGQRLAPTPSKGALTGDEQIEIALTALVASMQVLKGMRFCVRDLRVFSQATDRNGVATVKSISYQTMVRLATAFVNRAKTSLDSMKPVIDKELSLFCFEDLRTHSDIRLRFRAYARLCAVGIVSYHGSHRGEFREDVWPDFEYTSNASTDDASMVGFSRRELTCLRGDLGGPLYMFGNGPADPQSLALNFTDYADLWGPLWTSPLGNGTTGGISAIHTERGMIFKSRIPHPLAEIEEVTCHWIPTKPH